MRRALTLSLMLAAVLVVSAAGPAQAKPPQHVDLYSCATLGGVRYVEFKGDVFVTYGWAATNWRHLRQFLNLATLTVRVDGVKIRQEGARWGLPIYDEEGQYWYSIWSSRLARFHAGEVRTVTLQVSLAKQHFDGVDYYGPGKIYEPRLSCDISAP